MNAGLEAAKRRRPFEMVLDGLLAAVRAGAVAANILAIAALVVTAGILIYEIIARFVFNQPTGWSDAAAALLLPCLVFMGAGYALLRDAHIRIDTLYVRVTRPVQRWLALANETIGLVVLALLLWFTIALVMRSHRTEAMATLGTHIFPEWWAQVPVPLGVGVMFAVQLSMWLLAILALVQPDREAHQQSGAAQRGASK